MSVTVNPPAPARLPGRIVTAFFVISCAAIRDRDLLQTCLRCHFRQRERESASCVVTLATLTLNAAGVRAKMPKNRKIIREPPGPGRTGRSTNGLKGRLIRIVFVACFYSTSIRLRGGGTDIDVRTNSTLPALILCH